MPQARATWTDERLDDLSRRVDDGFNRVDEDLRALRGELNQMGDQLRGEMNQLRSDVNGRMDALQRSMLQVGGGMMATFVAGFLALVAAQLIQA